MLRPMLQDPGDTISLLVDAIAQLVGRAVTAIFTALGSVFASIYAVVVALAFNLTLAFERALSSFPLIHPIFAWIFFGALLGVAVGLWRQFPRYGLENARWVVALVPTGFLLMGLLLDRQPATVVGQLPGVAVATESVEATVSPTPAAAARNARREPKRQVAAAAKKTPTPAVKPPLRTLVDTTAHTSDSQGRGSAVTLPKGSAIEVLERQGNWLKVRVLDWPNTPVVTISRSSMFPIEPVDPRNRVVR